MASRAAALRVAVRPGLSVALQFIFNLPFGICMAADDRS